MIILSLDLGKFKSVACRMSEDVKETPKFSTHPSNPPAFDRLIRAVQPAQVVIEACSMAGWVFDLCQKLDVQCIVAHPGGDAWAWKRVKRKTDRDDALKLARMVRNGELESAYIPAPQQRQYRQLVKYRKKLQGQLVSIKNSIRGLLLSQAIACPSGKAAFAESLFLQELQLMAKPLNECATDELWRGMLHSMLQNLDATKKQFKAIDAQLEHLAKLDQRITRVRTIAGVGRVGAEAIVAHIDNPHRFKNQRQVSAYAGLVPKQWQSGTIDLHNRITKRGPKLLRTQLVEVAWASLRYNPYLNELYHRVKGKSKSRKKQAIIAVARKILVIAWAMLRDETDWKQPELNAT